MDQVCDIVKNNTISGATKKLKKLDPIILDMFYTVCIKARREREGEQTDYRKGDTLNTILQYIEKNFQHLIKNIS